MWPVATDITRSVVFVSVGVLDTLMYYAKMAEPTEMPFGGLTYVGPVNQLLDVCIMKLVVVVTAPHQPRLDWQMWFAALGSYQHNPWFLNFVYRLLMNEREGL